MIRFFKKYKVELPIVDEDTVMVVLADRGAGLESSQVSKNLTVWNKNPGREVKPLFMFRKPRIEVRKKK